MLIVTQVAPYADGPAGVHGVLGQAATALQELATMHGLDPTVVTDVGDVSPDRLGRRPRPRAVHHRRDAVVPRAEGSHPHVLASTGSLRILGVHSATDANHPWPEYGAMLGARFDGHPWTQDFAIDVIDDTHPATAHLAAQSQSPWHWRDEVYLFADLRPDAHVLLRLAEDQVDLSAPGRPRPRLRLPPGLDRRGRRRPHLLQRPRPFPRGMGDAGLPAAPGRGPRLADGDRLT